MRHSIAIFSSLVILAGCFNEPEPAYKTVPAANRVYLSDKGLKDLASSAEALKAGAAIDYLNLDRNAFETLPPEVAKLTGLKWLRLNDNRLTTLPSLATLASLRRIYLKNNRFAAVPEALKDLPSLTDVDLSGNPIKEIPAWLAAKKGLVNLSFSNTRLAALPQDLSAWQSLATLQLGGLSLKPEEMARVRAALPRTAVVY